MGCHSFAISGNRVCKSLNPFDTELPEQYGHPLDLFVLLFTDASHWWSGQLEHFHRTFLADPYETVEGSQPSASFAISGN